MEEQVTCIREHLIVAQDRQKKYADAHKVDRQFLVGDSVFLRVRPQNSLIRNGKGSKLAPQFVGAFDILERISPIYHLALPSSSSCIHDVFHLSVLRLYHPDISHVLDWNALKVEHGQLSLDPMRTLQCKEMSLRV